MWLKINKLLSSKYKLKRICTAFRYHSTYSRNRPLNGLSYLSVPGEQPLLGITLGQLLDNAAVNYGSSEALVVCHQGIRRSFRDLKDETEALASGFLATGLKKGDRIGIWGPNSHEWYITQLGAAKAGLILVNINPAYEGREVLYALNKVEIRALVMAEEFRNRNYYEILKSVVPSLSDSKAGKVNDSNCNSLSTVISMSKQNLNGTYTFDSILEKGLSSEGKSLLSAIYPLIQFDDIFNIQFTSGTTGKPKGVMLSHHNIVNNSFLVAKRLEVTQKDKLCIPVPFFHCYGSVGGVMVGIHAGSTAVIPDAGFDPMKTIESIERERCTVLYGTPTMHVDMTNMAQGRDFSSLRMAATAGSSCPHDLAKEIGRLYGANVVSFYGLTETSPVFFQTLPEDNLDLRITTVGYPQEHTEVKVVDRNGHVVPIGVEGEMCARGYMTMLGYWNDTEKTNEVLKDSGWFHTGDTFILDESGHGRIVGRMKDIIIRGGENIYPREIEEFLHLHPKILEAHVFGIPDDRLGEVVGVWIRLKDGEQLDEKDIKNYAKGKIAGYKIPKYIFFRNDFPKTTSGKIQKFKMREETIKILGIKN